MNVIYFLCLCQCVVMIIQCLRLVTFGSNHNVTAVITNMGQLNGHMLARAAT